MRRATNGGPCERCGTTAPGLYWRSVAKTLDFGSGTPVETAAVGPRLCDDCEHKRRIANEPGYASLCGVRQ